MKRIAFVLQVLTCVGALSGCLTPHLHLVLPPILAIIDDVTVHMNVREAALRTILQLGGSYFVALSVHLP